MFKFRLVAGRHVEGKGDSRKRFKAGDIIETTKDLAKLFNKSGSVKFAPLDGATATVEKSEQSTLESMTIQELKQLAEAEEVEVPSNARKDQIIAAILAAAK